MEKFTLRGNKFIQDDKGFISGPVGPLGHREECEEFAQVIQTLMDITKSIQLTDCFVDSALVKRTLGVSS